MLTAKHIPALRNRLTRIGFPQRYQRSGKYAGTETASLEKNPTMLEWLDAFEKASKDVTPANRKAWLLETMAKGGKGIQEWADAVLFNVNKDVLVHNFALNAFFEQVTLQNDEWPILETRVRDGKFRFTTVGQNGGRVKRQTIEGVSHVQPHLEKYSSNWKEFQLMNLQTGDVSEADRVRNELRFEFNHAIDSLAKALLDSSANFIASGLRAKLNLHPDIQTANIPDKNYLDLNSVGTAGKFDVEKLKQILEYFVMFSDDVELDGEPLALKVMFISTQNRRDFWDMAQLVAGYDTSGTALDDPKDVLNADGVMEIWKTGGLTSAYGETFATIARNNIPKGTVYCASNKPLGYYFTKPGMSGSLVKGGEEAVMNNMGAIEQHVVHVFAVPEPWIYRYLRVKL